MVTFLTSIVLGFIAVPAGQKLDASSRRSSEMARSWRALCPAVDYSELMMMMMRFRSEVGNISRDTALNVVRLFQPNLTWESFEPPSCNIWTNCELDCLRTGLIMNWTVYVLDLL
jgi:hypothetical protein